MTDFYGLVELPVDPPEVTIGEHAVDRYATDWRVPGGEVSDSVDSLDKVARISTQGSSLELRVNNSATPSSFGIGVYRGSLDSFDPTSRPEVSYDCLTGPECVLGSLDDQLGLDLSPLWPEGEQQAVFVITASYFALDDETPYANSLAWVTEITR